MEHVGCVASIALLSAVCWVHVTWRDVRNWWALQLWLKGSSDDKACFQLHLSVQFLLQSPWFPYCLCFLCNPSVCLLITKHYIVRTLRHCHFKVEEPQMRQRQNILHVFLSLLLIKGGWTENLQNFFHDCGLVSHFMWLLKKQTKQKNIQVAICLLMMSLLPMKVMQPGFVGDKCTPTRSLQSDVLSTSTIQQVWCNTWVKL